MKKYLLFLTILIGWFLGSCRPVETLPTSDPTSTFQPTLSAEPGPAATGTPLPSATVAPAETASLPSATPTVIGTIVAMIEPTVYSSHLSPDGKWLAEVVRYDCVPVSDVEDQAFEQLNLTQTDSSSTLLADSQLQSCGGVGAFGLAGLFWGPNSRYFYYTHAREGYPDGMCGYWAPPFLRFEVSNPASEYLGIGSLSPDGSKLATWQEQDLVLWDTNAGEIGRVPAFDANAGIGPVAWSPDSQSLVYVQVESYCPVSGKSYVVQLDLPDLEQTLLLESESPTFGNAAWDSPNELTLFDENGDEWRYNLDTKELQGSP